MDIYLPIAGQAVNALFIIALGGFVGILSGMFGVGGGFLTTPLRLLRAPAFFRKLTFHSCRLFEFHAASQ
jgi:hypothetical protein